MPEALNAYAYEMRSHICMQYSLLFQAYIYIHAQILDAQARIVDHLLLWDDPSVIILSKHKVIREQRCDAPVQFVFEKDRE